METAKRTGRTMACHGGPIHHSSGNDGCAGYNSSGMLCDCACHANDSASKLTAAVVAVRQIRASRAEALAALAKP